MLANVVQVIKHVQSPFSSTSANTGMHANAVQVACSHNNLDLINAVANSAPMHKHWFQRTSHCTHAAHTGMHANVVQVACAHNNLKLAKAVASAAPDEDLILGGGDSKSMSHQL